MTNIYRPLSRNNRGPRSPEGKAAGALHHLGHGLTSARTVLPGEDPAEWARFLDAMLTDLEPDGSLETRLAFAFADACWRLRRVPGAEQRAWGAAQVCRDEPGAGRRPSAEHHRTMSVLVPDFDALDLISRYEEGLTNILCRSLRQLHFLQDRRRGNRPMLASLYLHYAKKIRSSKSPITVARSIDGADVPRGTKAPRG